MNLTTIRMQRLAIKIVDWILLIGIVVWTVHSIMKADDEHRFFIAMAGLVGLAVINAFGKWALIQIARLNHEETMTKREQTRKEQFERDHGSTKKH